MDGEPKLVPKVHPLSRPMEEGDPLELMALQVPGDPAEMARCVIEEFLQLGMPPNQVQGMFADPQYPALVSLARRLGMDRIEQLVQEAWTLFGAFRVRVQYAEPPTSEAPETVPLKNPFASK